MRIGVIGLGRMGGNMARRLLRAGHEVVAYDQSIDRVNDLRGEGAIAGQSINAIVAQLAAPRAIWVMLPAGSITDNVISSVAERLQPGDIVIDGGNTYYKDDVRRAHDLGERGIHYVDVGTSGGIWGLERGYSLMIGGDREAVAALDPIFRALAPGRAAASPTANRTATAADEGYLHCGAAGAGHFVKMVHNGIEYGLMQAYAEGFDILRNAPTGYRFRLDEIAEVWRRGSVVGSWLLDLAAAALAEDPDLKHYVGSVEDSGEGRWTIMAAIEEAVPADVLSAALYSRFRSRLDHTFGEKLLSAMRDKFGGHREH